MKKLFAVVALAVLAGNVATADDKGTEFKFGGEVRTRYSVTNNGTFSDGGAPSESHFQQRNQFHVNAITSDKLQAYFNFLHATLWGSGVPAGASAGGYASAYTTGLGAGSHGTAAAGSNTLLVHEAWMWWKLSDMLSLKAGRSTMTYGDGLVFSKFDWASVPYNFEGLMGRFSWDFLDLDVGGGKFADAGLTTARGTDTEINGWLVYGAFKNLPDVLKAVDLFLLQIMGDAGTGTTATFVPGVATLNTTYGGVGSWNVMTIGGRVKGEVSMVDFRLDGAFQNGKMKSVAAGIGDGEFGGMMFDAEVGVNFPEFMKGRAYVGYHMDSGEETPTSGNNTKIEGYQPLFYDNHTYAGRMDLVGFGNLTDISVGLGLSPSDDTTLGLEVSLLSRSTDKGLPTVLARGEGVSTTINTSIVGGTYVATNTEKNLGTEIDVWAKHDYGHGLSVMGRFGYLTLGDYFTKGVTTGITKNAMQFVAQATYNF